MNQDRSDVAQAPQLASPALAADAALLPLPADVYRLLIEEVQAAIFISHNERFRYANPKLLELFGYSSADLAAMNTIALCAPHDRDRVREQVRQRVAGTPGRPYEVECIRKDGSLFNARVWGRRIELDGGPADLITLHDITETKQATLAARRRAQLVAQTEELALIGSCEYEVATDLVTQSAGMFRIFGEPVSEEPVPGAWLLDRVPVSEREYVHGILHCVMPGEPCEFEHRIVRADGSVRTVLHRATGEGDAAGRTVRVIGILQDITAQRTAERQRDELAQCDTVTGLPNRTVLLDRLDDAVRRARREGGAAVLILIEIDQLQIVTESLGFQAGDRLLAAVGERLSEVVREPDLLAHLGSGEYAALLTDLEGDAEASSLAVAQALLETLATPFMIDDTELRVTGSAGITASPKDGTDCAQLLLQAQAAMRRAHEQGDNQVLAYTPETHAKWANRLALEAALRRAVERGAFQLRYQPQLDLTSGKIIGVEALVRWTDPVLGPISPVDFIPLAEETGLIIEIGEWVLRTACEQGVAWQHAGLAPVRVAVNLSVRQLQQPDIARRIQAILLETRLDPRLLGLEITESVLMDASSHVAHVLAELKALGIEISLDDFGTGYSNLNYLRTLPIDVVKVDRSFVHDVTAAPQEVSVTRAVINMAHSLQMKVLAEGVETEGQLSLLIAGQCDQMQGYYFSAPVAADAIATMLREGRQLPEHLLQRRERKRTLLLVDDEENILSALKRLLRRDGYQIVTAIGGPQGLQRLAEYPVDVIVSDQRMPGMTGVEFLRRAKELYPDTVRMVLSGYTELQSITDAINEGAIYKFLTKPWDDERLRSHIVEAFRHKEMADENRRLGFAVRQANQELADVNDRLQHLLEAQRQRISREETSLAVARDMLDSIPAPVIGLDLDGMVAFLNADAEILFAAHAPGMLGRNAEDALPPDLLRVCRNDDGGPMDVMLGGRPYQAICRRTGQSSRSQGRLLLLFATSAALLEAAQ